MTEFAKHEEATRVAVEAKHAAALQLTRQVENTLRAQPSLDRRTAIAILGRLDDRSPWQLQVVVSSAGREAAITRATRRGFEVKAIRALDVHWLN